MTVLHVLLDTTVVLVRATPLLSFNALVAASRAGMSVT
jgi:hypothetical protein